MSDLTLRLRVLRQQRRFRADKAQPFESGALDFERAMQQAKQHFAWDMVRLEQSLAQNRQLLAELEARQLKRVLA